METMMGNERQDPPSRERCPHHALVAYALTCIIHEDLAERVAPKTYGQASGLPDRDLDSLQLPCLQKAIVIGR